MKFLKNFLSVVNISIAVVLDGLHHSTHIVISGWRLLFVFLSHDLYRALTTVLATSSQFRWNQLGFLKKDWPFSPIHG